MQPHVRWGSHLFSVGFTRVRTFEGKDRNSYTCTNCRTAGRCSNDTVAETLVGQKYNHHHSRRHSPQILCSQLWLWDSNMFSLVECRGRKQMPKCGCALTESLRAVLYRFPLASSAPCCQLSPPTLGMADCLVLLRLFASFPARLLLLQRMPEQECAPVSAPCPVQAGLLLPANSAAVFPPAPSKLLEHARHMCGRILLTPFSHSLGPFTAALPDTFTCAFPMHALFPCTPSCSHGSHLLPKGPSLALVPVPPSQCRSLLVSLTISWGVISFAWSILTCRQRFKPL